MAKRADPPMGAAVAAQSLINRGARTWGFCAGLLPQVKPWLVLIAGALGAVC